MKDIAKKSKNNIIKDLRNKICRDMLLCNESDFTSSEVEIINICADIINNILDEKDILEKELIASNITITNLEIEVDELKIEKQELIEKLKTNDR